MRLDTTDTIHACADPEVVQAYEAQAEESSRLRNEARAEALERWKRDVWFHLNTGVDECIGISVDPADSVTDPLWKEWGEAGGHSVGFDENPTPSRKYPELWAIPLGWRRRKADGYLSPPLKKTPPRNYVGTPEDAETARDFCRRFTHQSVRGYVEKEYGVQLLQFSGRGEELGIRLITCGLTVIDGVLYTHGAKGHVVKDERFVVFPTLEYFALVQAQEEKDREERGAEDDDDAAG